MLDQLYDPCATLPPGLLLDRETQETLVLAAAVNRGQRLTAAQIEALLGPGLPVPTMLRRLPDSNPQGQGAPWRPSIVDITPLPPPVPPITVPTPGISGDYLMLGLIDDAGSVTVPDTLAVLTGDDDLLLGLPQ